MTAIVIPITTATPTMLVTMIASMISIAIGLLTATATMIAAAILPMTVSPAPIATTNAISSDPRS